MKITKVQPLLIGRFCFVRIETDAGIVGIGESGALQGNKIVIGLAQHVDGFVSGAPGIGFQPVEDAEKRFPYKPKPVEMLAHVDGSFVDQ
jgi:hypothetical protein